jgi:hypothetical protein
VSHLTWSWLSLPYLVCALVLAGVAVTAAVTRGDRVLRLGAIGATVNALPWALCSMLVTFTDDPDAALHLLRLGNGPLALVGPALLLMVLGASGQLERHRWLARIAGVVGGVLLVVCWMTDLVISGVRPLASGMLYLTAGPLSGPHFWALGIWVTAGLVILWRSTTVPAERRRVRVLIALSLGVALAATSDLLLVYDAGDWYPISAIATSALAAVALYHELATDLLRPQGLDRPALAEVIAFVVALAVVGAFAVVFEAASAVAIAGVAGVTWAVALGIVWARFRDRPAPVASDPAFEELAAEVAELDAADDEEVAERLTALWRTLGITTHRVERVASDETDRPSDFARIDHTAVAWFAVHDDALATNDLGTAILGPLRPVLEELLSRYPDGLIVPLIDRGRVLALAFASHRGALREEARGLVVESARAAARGLAYLALTRSAARERETAREVEVAEAMRQQVVASRDDELGHWAVAAEYRTAPRTTGASWSATLLPDGRLAVLVAEAEAHGVPAALATSALTGAFAAATALRTDHPLELDDVLASLRASAEGVVRGGEPVAAFVAILDDDARTVAWACAGHPGGALVALDRTGEPAVTVLGGGTSTLGASLVTTRGTARLPAGALLVVVSTALRPVDDDAWLEALAVVAPAGRRLANVLVEQSIELAPVPAEDLLAIVVRERLERRSVPIALSR